MDSFYYKAIQESGKIIEQTVQARNKQDLVVALKAKNFKIISIKKKGIALKAIGGKITNLEKANFCRYLSVMLKSGLSISEAIEIIASETSNIKMKEILENLAFEMQEGGEISASLDKYPSVFDDTFLALVRAGEQSGSLEKTFSYLADQLYSVHRLNKKITGAMMYPAVILMAMFGVGILMMVFVLPRLSQTFLKMKIPLPLPTRMLLEFGNFVGENTIWVILGLAGIITFFMFLFSFYKTRKIINRLLTNAPVLKRLFKEIDLARFSRTLSSLLQSGVPIVRALQISSKTLTQNDMKKVAAQFEKGVSEGQTIADVLSLSKRKAFPALMIQTIKTGEKTGTLDTVLKDLADYYEEELEDMLKEFASIIEPIIMLVIGVAVGAMVIMIIAPIYSVMGTIQNAGQGGGM